jgi:hypothetical protein
MLQTRVGDWMQTASGRQFWPLDPRPHEVCIEDIAHALAMLCRYGGHCLRFYSVAEHSVLLARSVPRSYRLWALLHDAAEAYTIDLIRPLKRSLPEYKKIEASVMHAICVRFNLHLGVPAIVKLNDNRLLADEKLQNMAAEPERWDDLAEPLGVVLQYWSPDRARAEFLSEFERIGARR